MTIAFDAAEIVATVDAIRPDFPAAAKLIEDLWAEVKRTTADDYVSPGRQLTEADSHGPFLPEPTVDVEFFDLAGHACGSATTRLAAKINEHGLLIISDQRFGFTAEHNLTVAGYRVWIGSDMIETHIKTVKLRPGDRYLIEFNLPIKLGRDIDHRDDGSGRGPERPIQPDPRGAKVE